MKWTNALWIIILIACESSETNPLITLKGNNDINYTESIGIWTDLKAKNGSSYKYTIISASVFGFGSETEITINNNLAVARSYREFETNDQGVQETTSSYDELGSELGTHERGAELVTIDALYESCASEFLTVDEAENSLYFSAFDVGIISTCGYVPNGCMDDCFRGIRVDSFQWL